MQIAEWQLAGSGRLWPMYDDSAIDSELLVLFDFLGVSIDVDCMTLEKDLTVTLTFLRPNESIDFQLKKHYTQILAN